MFSKIACLALLASSAFAHSTGFPHNERRQGPTDILSAVTQAQTSVANIKAEVLAITKFATKKNGTAVTQKLSPLVKQLPTVLTTLKADLQAIKKTKRDIVERQAPPDNLAIAAAVAALIADLALTIAGLEVLISTIPLLNNLLIPVLFALNPLLLSVLLLLDSLLTGVLVIVANLLYDLLGPNGIINLIPLLTGLGTTLGQLLGGLLSGIGI